MTDTSWLGPPIDVRPLFARQQAAFIDLLRGFGPAQWAQPTICAGWGNPVAEVLCELLKLCSGYRPVHGNPSSPCMPKKL